MKNTVNIVPRQSNLQKYEKPREFRGTPYGTILSQALYGKVQRLSRNGVHSSEWKREAPDFQGDDIVSSMQQCIAVHKRTHKEQRPLWKILDIQARLYWRIIRQCMDNDDYFKDFELKPYRFIVVNRHNTKPLVWEFPETSNEEELTYGYRRLRTPWCIGKELSEYLKVRPAVPNGIKTVGLNNITEYLKEKYGREDTNQVDEAG